MTDWPHSPVHRLGESGAYMVTASTYRKELVFHSPRRLTLVCDTLFTLAEKLGWELQVWAVMPNHYHFIAVSPERPESLRSLLRRLHSWTARSVNTEDGMPRRRVWFQYWEAHITFERSYFARLNYVNRNPVHHGLITDAEQYQWYSAAWFARTSDAPFCRMVGSFPTDRLNVMDVD